MPNYKIRKADLVRNSKGKCASEINYDIMEQCTADNKKILNLNCDEVFQIKTDDDSPKVDDRRTFDEIMIDSFEEFNSKSSRVRTNALRTICTQLKRTYDPGSLSTHIGRLVNIIENALQSSLPCEINAAANLISLAAIQLPDTNRSMQMFYEPLKAALKNGNVKSSVRSVCHAMGILTFLYEADRYEIFKVMKEFKDIFVPNSYYQSCDETSKKIQAVNYEFQAAAFETWIFLLTLLPSRLECERTLKFSLPAVESSYTINTLLQTPSSPYFNLHVDCAKPHLTKIIRKISPIINAWNKNASDIETAAEVLQHLQHGITPSKHIRGGKYYVLRIDNWASNVQYEMICNVMGSANVPKHFSRKCNEKLLWKLKAAQSPYDCTSAPAQQKGYDFERISKNLEFATSKSSMERTKALEEICNELHLVPHTFLADQKNLILDIILKAMKRGNETEQSAVVRLATLTVLRLGRDERFCSEISNAFSNSLKHSFTISTNASICTALAFFELVDHQRANGVHCENLMNLFRQIFFGSQQHCKTFKGDSSNEQSNWLRLKALEAWGLLLTLCSPKDVCSLVKSQTIKDLTEMLRTSNVEFQIACGHVISIIIEQGRIYDGNYLKSNIPGICDVIKDAVNDRKNISSDKRKIQNPKLREILKYLEDGCHISFMLRFAEEIHELKTWSSLFKYQKLCQFIGPNLATHLSQNDRIREILSIGSKPVVVPFQLKPNLQYKLRSASKKNRKQKKSMEF